MKIWPSAAALSMTYASLMTISIRFVTGSLPYLSCRLSASTADGGCTGEALLAQTGYQLGLGTGVGGPTPRCCNGGCGIIGEDRTSATGCEKRRTPATLQRSGAQGRGYCYCSGIGS